jgi:hypothetical protein
VVGGKEAEVLVPQLQVCRMSAVAYRTAWWNRSVGHKVARLSTRWRCGSCGHDPNGWTIGLLGQTLRPVIVSRFHGATYASRDEMLEDGAKRVRWSPRTCPALASVHIATAEALQRPQRAGVHIGWFKVTAIWE